MALRYDEIADLIKIIDASACEELVLETTDLKLVIRRTLGATSSAVASPGIRQDAAVPPQPIPVPAGSGAATNNGPAPTPSGIAKGSTIRAPMVGVFYRAPSPEAAPFVEVGFKVAPGDPLCVIEVMKLFTTIYAETAGRVVQICAANAEFVEYDRVLFVME